MSKLSNTPSHQDPTTWLRDAVQARILAKMFSDKTSGIVLKGGLAMRLAHGQVRHTKDIDLDADKDMPMSDVQALVTRALNKAAFETLNNHVITAPKQTDTTMRWKISGEDPESGSVLHLTVEVSHRRCIDNNHTRKVKQEGSNSEVTVYKDEVLAFNKVCALLSNNRSAPRDIIDLHMLISAKIEPPIDLLKAWVASRDKMATSLDVWSKVEEMTRERFELEVAPSLARPADFSDWEYIQLSVAATIDEWLNSATKEKDESDDDSESESFSARGKSCRAP